MPIVVDMVARLGRHKDLLYGVHERAEDQRCQHHEHQRRRDYELVVLVRVAVWARLSALAVPLDLEDEREGDGAADHACVRDEDELVELDRLLLEAASAHVEGRQDAHNPTTENDRQLNEHK